MKWKETNKKHIILQNENKQHKVSTPSQELFKFAASNKNVGFKPSRDWPPYFGENSRHLSYGVRSYRYPSNKVFSRIYGTIFVDQTLYMTPQEKVQTWQMEWASRTVDSTTTTYPSLRINDIKGVTALHTVMGWCPVVLKTHTSSDGFWNMV